MRNTPSITSPPSVSADAVEVRPIRYLRAAQIVGERSLTPLVFPHHHPLASAESVVHADVQPPAERRHGIERRSFFRRIRQQGARLYDTRAAEERRRGNRRNSDITTRIEEKI